MNQRKDIRPSIKMGAVDKDMSLKVLCIPDSAFMLILYHKTQHFPFNIEECLTPVILFLIA